MPTGIVSFSILPFASPGLTRSNDCEQTIFIDIPHFVIQRAKLKVTEVDSFLKMVGKHDGDMQWTLFTTTAFSQTFDFEFAVIKNTDFERFN